MSSAAQKQPDALYRYLFEQANVRGELVQIEDAYQQMIKNHAYPPAIATLLGELLAVTSLLTATLKFEGQITVQLQGDGPVRLAVINGNHQQRMRGVARFEGTPEGVTLQELVGKGHMVITIAPEQGERYQGVVGLDETSLANTIESYFQQSEQLATQIQLFADSKQCGGMLLQILPVAEQAREEFDHLAKLTETIKQQELFTLSANEILHRLYHQEEVRLFEPQPVQFHCGCSRERTAAALRSMPKAELDSLIEELGMVEITCEYCREQQNFDAIDIEALFSNSAPLGDQSAH
ncbi:Hsp33 family molecular chaperone HslO [Corallincola luteus]|uniref:33 kDa chaperonin n=1 Tax=Corallincola luteus TaxID=1775177 RepID=A0ABY2AJH0_9GAMM|nr:Hsp33 family molecular chaperone HslO [Corallincola luteus]TCI01430.1 Hsp33 family molecular chaperone HslO [Corallincola luteus]